MFLDCTVAIGNPNKEWLGTGFLYLLDKEPYLVTNRHVLEDIHEKHQEIVIRYNYQRSTKEFFVKLGTKENPTYFSHPISDIDISIISIYYSNIDDEDVKLIPDLKIGAFTQNLSFKTEEMKDKPISEGDFIYVIGFPLGMDSVNKKTPIVRTGCIARIKDLYEGETKQFLLDSFIFPGNSGSPVITKPEPFRLGDGGPGNQPRLLGIVEGYECYQEKLVTENKAELRSITLQNAGLTRVYPVDYIIQTIRAYEKGKSE